MRKLLVVLGAGSSLGLGLPSVDAIDDLMKVWAADWPTADIGGEDYCAAVEAPMRAYVDSSTVTNQHRAINLENVLGDLANWVLPVPHGTTLRGLVSMTSSPELKFPK